MQYASLTWGVDASGCIRMKHVCIARHVHRSIFLALRYLKNPRTVNARRTHFSGALIYVMKGATRVVRHIHVDAFAEGYRRRCEEYSSSQMWRWWSMGLIDGPGDQSAKMQRNSGRAVNG